MAQQTMHPAESATKAMVDERRAMSRAAVAGAVAALAGGIAWAVIAVETQSEIGYVATAIGLLAGLAVHVSTRKHRGLLSQRDWMRLRAVAVASAALGIAVGKYLFFDLDHGGFSPGVSQIKMVGYFFRMLPQTLKPVDGIWLALAVTAAWTITRLSELRRLR